MPVKEASSEETPYGRYVTSKGWFVLNLADALAVRNEKKGGAMYPLEPRESPFGDFGARVRVVWPRDPNALYHAEGVQEGFLVFSGECTLIVEEVERPLRQWEGGDAPLPGERGGGKVRRVRRQGDRGSGRGVRRLAGRVPSNAHCVAARFRLEAVTMNLQSSGARSRPTSARPPHPHRADADQAPGRRRTPASGLGRGGSVRMGLDLRGRRGAALRVDGPLACAPSRK